MNKYFIFIVFILLSYFTKAQKYFNTQEAAFIHNVGQFDGRNWEKNKILFAIDRVNNFAFFTKEGVTYRFDKIIRNPELKDEKEAHENPNEPERVNKSELVFIKWVNSNPDVEIIAEDKLQSYYSYSIYTSEDRKNVKNINHINGYKKLIYKNLYDNIDLIYTFPEKGGLEYTFIVHPGGDPNQIKMQYSSAHTNIKDEYVNISFTNDHKIKIDASNNKVTEYPPIAFYNDNKEEVTVETSFNNNILSFNVPNFDTSKTLTIDPWVVSETANSGNSSSAVWEVETDASGNIYTISNEDHMQLKKYNSSGAIQWTYNTPWDTSSVWLGTLATDETGTSYITSGTLPEMQKVDANGNMVWDASYGTTNPLFSGETGEWWSITFNCDKTKLIVGGTYAPDIMGTDFYASIYNIDITNGDVLSHVELAYTNIGGFGNVNMPEEVRAIAPTNNSKYVFLTHKQVGVINQNIGECPNDQPDFQVSNQEELAYKCEDYLPATQNGGGLKALISNDNYFYTHTGDEIRQWDVTNGNLVNTATIPGGSAETNSIGKTIVHNSGLSVDDQGNIYAGSDGKVIKFDPNLNVLQTAVVDFTVYDVSVNSNGEVIACGAQLNNDTTNSDDRHGKIQAVNLGSSGQYAPTCCDVNICHPDTLCQDDSPITIDVSNPGGTFSGNGIIDANNGTFDPSVAGVGTHTITYTKSCGSESVDVVVLACTPIEVCDDGTNYLGSGGSGTLSWYDWETVTTQITDQETCEDCAGMTWDPGILGIGAHCEDSNGNTVDECTQPGWVQISSNGTLDPSNINSWPIMITDNMDTITFNSSSEITSCGDCTPATLSETHNDETCEGNNDGSIDLTINGSSSSYTISWSGPNGYTSSNEDITNLEPGTYTVTVTDASNASCDTTLSVTINQGAATEDASFTFDNFCEGAPNSATITGVTGGTFSFNPTPSNGETINANTGEISNAIGGNIYTVVYTTSGTCPGTESHDVTVYANPTPTISGSLTFCAGGSTTLDAGTGYTSYQWSPNNETTQTITANQTGTYSVTVTDINGCSGSNSVSVTESNGLSPQITGVLSICSGSATTLDAGAGYASYQWSPNNETTQTITVSQPGTYSVTVDDGNGCSGSDEVTVVANENPDPQITGSLSFCTGSSTTLDAGSGYNNYEWNNSATTQTINVSQAGTYSVTVTDNNGCTGSDQVTVEETNGLSPTISGDLAICQGQATILDAGSGYGSYSWNTGATSQTITVNQAGTYSVTVSDNSGCSGSTSVNVTESPELHPQITGNTNICEGSSTTLDAGSGYDSYQWNTGDNTQTIVVNQAGTYSVTVSNNGGCSGNTSVTVNLKDFKISISGNLTVCNGSSTTLSVNIISGGTPPFSYFWNTGDNSSSITVSPTSATTYTVYVVDADGCTSNTATASVNVSAPVNINVTANKDSICPGDAVIISSLITGGIPPYTITDVDGNVTSGNEIVHPEEETVYTYTVTDACGSTDTDADTVHTYEVPVVDFMADILQGCEPLAVTFTSTTSSNSNYSYEWYFGDIHENNLSFSQTITHTFENFGVYDIGLTVTTDKGCKASTIKEKLITVYRKPKAMFTTNPSTVNIVNPTIYFNNLSSYANFYIWSFGDGDSSNIEDPVHKYTQIQDYTVGLIAVSSEGCKDTVYSKIVVEDVFTLYVPTAFSPDNDGINDVFICKGNGINLDAFNLKVYDRWGEIIWETNDIFTGWDGSYQDSKKIAENGVYIWLITLKTSDGTEYQRSGNVTLIR